jgi:beta-lactamase superfamily II metal-dependent hydrolase
MAIQVTIRMYRLNELGDCFFLRFVDGEHASNMLIDCGSFRNSKASIARLTEIVTDIKDNLKGQKLDVVVGTHQHNDHVNGFHHCKALFQRIGIEEVWLSWLDDPADKLAKRTADEFSKLRANLTQALHLRLKQKGVSKKDAAAAFELLEASAVLAAGKTPVVPQDAVDTLKQLGEKDPRYLSPGTTVLLPGFAASKLRIHVLGPPRDMDKLHDITPGAGESYDKHLQAANKMSQRLLDALKLTAGKDERDSRDYPFNNSYKRKSPTKADKRNSVQSSYYNTQDAWRKIDTDWMDELDGLALYLDSYTNNSSLAFAIECVESGKVLLFPADAQTGNWLSWFDLKWADKKLKTEDLLKRTTIYKVGHHGSHNATLVAALEMMSEGNLSALMPVHKDDANIRKENGWRMPAAKLEDRLRQKTQGRILRHDGVFKDTANPKTVLGQKLWKKVNIKVREENLYYELVAENL